MAIRLFSWIASLTGGPGGTSNSFATVQPTSGTSPTAASPTDTLTLTSSDSSVSIVGDSSTDTLSFTVVGKAATAHTHTASDTTDFSTAADARISASSLVSAGRNGVIGITIDGGGSAITTGVKGYVEVPYACTITGWTLVADQSGSIVIDVWKDTYANAPPTVADTIAGSEKPTLASVQKNQDLTLSTWTTTVTAGDIIGFNVDSASTVTRVTLTLKVTKN